MSGVPAGRPGGFGARLRTMDMYRRIPKDLTESTMLGAAVSLISLLVIITLFGLNLRTMFEVHTNTKILIDHSEDGQLQINFKVTVPDLSCEFAAVDSVDMIGDRRHDLSGSAIYKTPIGGKMVSIEHAAKTTQVAPVYGNTTNVDHYGNTRYSMELNGDNWKAALDQFDALLVDFHAPWCPHCQRFAPIWEHAAEIVRKTLDEHERAGKPRSLAMGAVDCTTAQNLQLCRDQFIQAFPTVRVYRKGKHAGNKPATEAASHYEAYMGERSAEAVSAFALKVVQEVESNIVMPAAQGGDSKVHARGCTIQGSVMVSRVPGELHIVPTSRGHSLHMDNVNMTHVMEHLSFGGALPEDILKSGHWWTHRVAPRRSTPAVFPRDLGGRYVQKEEYASFISKKEHITHDHYLKVVPTQYTPIGRKEPIALYEYTISSNAYALEPPFLTSGETHDGPIIKIAYELSPLQVSIEEYRKPAIEGLLGMCSLLGGVYASSMLLEAALQALHSGVKKHIMGKKTE